MSEQSEGVGWWIASDGKWYPPEPETGGDGGVVEPEPETGGDGGVVEPDRRALLKRSMPAWVTLAVLALAALGGSMLAAGAADKDSTIAALEETLASVKSDLDSALDRLSDLDGRLDDAKKRAEGAEAEALAKAEETLADESAAVAAAAADVERREGEVTAREQQVDATINGLKASEFGPGIHQVGRDIQPGRYHTDGPSPGDSCYYAKLGPDGEDIIDNNNIEGPATVIINSAFFETSRCRWTKVG